MGNRNTKPTDNLAELVRKRNQSQHSDESYTKDRILEGLNVVAAYLRSKKMNVSLITVGGAVNTVLLGTRVSTGDVDIFYRTKISGTGDEKVMREVLQGGKVAERQLGLGPQWLNNHTVVYIPEETINDLYAKAIKQNEKVFHAPGLTLYAAPWDYSMMTKLDRAAKPGAKLYDISDAADYLHRFIAYDKRRNVKRSELRAWARRWKLTVPSDALMDKLAQAYKERYREEGIING